jgi:hypothetical protein
VSFVPCRIEGCGIVGLHRAHSIAGPARESLSRWRLCQTCGHTQRSKNPALRLAISNAYCPVCDLNKDLSCVK